MSPSHSTIKATETAIQNVFTLANSIDNKAVIAYREILYQRYLKASSTDKEYLAFQMAVVAALITFKVEYQWYKRMQGKDKQNDNR